MPGIDPVSLALEGAGAAAKIYGAYQANERATVAQHKLDELAKIPYSRYSVNPMSQRYGNMALNDITNPQGYSGAETAQFNQNLAKVGQAGYNNGLSIGGGSVAKAVLAGIGSNQVNALNTFAAGNNSIMRQNRNLGYGRYWQAANNSQNIDNMNINTEIQRRMNTEKALGGAVSSNRDYVQGTISNIGSDLIGAGLMKSYGGVDPRTRLGYVN